MPIKTIAGLSDVVNGPIGEVWEKESQDYAKEVKDNAEKSPVILLLQLIGKVDSHEKLAEVEMDDELRHDLEKILNAMVGYEMAQILLTEWGV